MRLPCHCEGREQAQEFKDHSVSDVGVLTLNSVQPCRTRTACLGGKATIAPAMINMMAYGVITSQKLYRGAGPAWLG